MRKLLPIALPVFVLVVITASFYLLHSQSPQGKMLGIKSASASHSQRKKPVRPPRRTLLSPTPIKVATPSPTRVSTPTPTKAPTPTPTAIPTSTPTPTPSTQSPSNEFALTSSEQYIMNKINEFRSSQGLGAVKPDNYTCDFARTRAEEISKSFNHDGFRNRIENNSLPYPSYSQVTENIAMTSNYQDVVNMWINSPGHAENMRKDTPFVCVKQHGNYYAYLGWKP